MLILSVIYFAQLKYKKTEVKEGYDPACRFVFSYTLHFTVAVNDSI